MNRLFVAIVFALVFATSSVQAADHQPYISGNLGLSMASDSTLSFTGIDIGEISFDPGLAIGGAIGYDFGKFRAEGEIGYHSWDMDSLSFNSSIIGCPCSGPVDGYASALSLMVNGYLDLPAGDSPVTPYLGLGLGLANVTVGFDGFDSDSDSVVAFQFMAGLGFEISPVATLTAGYRYFATSNPDFDGIEATVESHDFSAGIRFAF